MSAHLRRVTHRGTTIALIGADIYTDKNGPLERVGGISCYGQTFGVDCYCAPLTREQPSTFPSRTAAAEFIVDTLGLEIS